MLILPRRRAGFSSTSRVLHQLNIRVSMFSHQHLNLLCVCVCERGLTVAKTNNIPALFNIPPSLGLLSDSRWHKAVLCPPPPTSLRPTPFHRPRLFSSLGAHVRPPSDRANILFSCCGLFAFTKNRLGRHLPPLLKGHFCGAAAPGRDPSGTLTPPSPPP